MLYMNDYDLDNAARRFARTPNRSRLVTVVTLLREWANQNSDGWAYWPKPARAAATAMRHIQSTTNRENEERAANDITDAQRVAALRPIKAFLTRQGVDHSVVGL